MRTGRRINWAAIRARVQPLRLKIFHRVPRGLRFLLGLVLIVGGIFGFLPILGFWMIPLGVMVAALDVDLIRRWWRLRHHHQDAGQPGAPTPRSHRDADQDPDPTPDPNPDPPPGRRG